MNGYESPKKNEWEQNLERFRQNLASFFPDEFFDLDLTDPTLPVYLGRTTKQKNGQQLSEIRFNLVSPKSESSCLTLLSRKHLEINLSENGMWLSPLGLNPLFVNDLLVHKKEEEWASPNLFLLSGQTIVDLHIASSDLSVIRTILGQNLDHSPEVYQIAQTLSRISPNPKSPLPFDINLLSLKNLQTAGSISLVLQFLEANRPALENRFGLQVGLAELRQDPVELTEALENQINNDLKLLN
jgi:hypothetical protein